MSTDDDESIDDEDEQQQNAHVPPPHQQNDFLAPQPRPIRFFDFVPGVPFAMDPRNIVLLWEDFIARRRNQPPPPPVQEDEEILIYDINRRNIP